MTEALKRPKFAADSVTAPLRHSVFRRIWLASLLSNLGLLIQGVRRRLGDDADDIVGRQGWRWSRPR